MADVWEEAGPEIVRRSYWSFGPWSELWRVWKAMPEDGLTLEVRRVLPVEMCLDP